MLEKVPVLRRAAVEAFQEPTVVPVAEPACGEEKSNNDGERHAVPVEEPKLASEGREVEEKDFAMFSVPIDEPEVEAFAGADVFEARANDAANGKGTLPADCTRWD